MCHVLMRSSDLSVGCRIKKYELRINRVVRFLGTPTDTYRDRYAENIFVHFRMPEQDPQLMARVQSARQAQRSAIDLPFPELGGKPEWIERYDFFWAAKRAAQGKRRRL